MTPAGGRAAARSSLQWARWRQPRTVVALAVVVGVACSWPTSPPATQGDRARGPEVVEPEPRLPAASALPSHSPSPSGSAPEADAAASDGTSARGADADAEAHGVGPAASPVAAASGPSAVLVRSVGALPSALVEQVAAIPGVGAVASVRAGALLLRGSADAAGVAVDAPPPGWGVPLEAIAVDPATYGALLPESGADAITTLAPGRALLGATSARIRGLGAGARVDLDGGTLEIAGVVDDALVGSAELVLHPADADRLGLGGARYALARTDTGAAAAQQVVAAVLDGPGQVLPTDLGPAPWPASWREVLPQAALKERFGEFQIRPGSSGREMQQEPGWADAAIATAGVPIIGEVRCHTAVIGPLRAALAELEAAGLAPLVDAGDYAGCFSPRLIGPGAGPSRHAWGVAVDLNASRNPFGAASTQDPRLVEVMERHGFGFGGRWPVPDAMHFEYRG